MKSITEYVNGESSNVNEVSKADILNNLLRHLDGHVENPEETANEIISHVKPLAKIIDGLKENWEAGRVFAGIADTLMNFVQKHGKVNAIMDTMADW